MSNIWFMLCAGCLAALTLGPAAAGPPYLPAVDAIAVQALEDVPLAGLSIAIARGGEIIHAKGYGYANLEHKVPATPETVYRIGSVGKQFTAAAILQLVEQGKLSLDDNLHEFLPDYPTGGRRVTIRQLLNHTSGIHSVSSIKEAMANRCLDVTQQQMIGWMSQTPFDFEPGERFMYNNSGFWLSGVIIEHLSGRSYPDFVQAKLFEPLGLDDTYYESYSRLIPNRAQGYTLDEGRLVNAELNSPTRPYAAGAIMTTVLDLIEWQRAFLSGRVVTPASVETMTTPGRLNSGKVFPYGLGLWLMEFDGHRTIQHGGGIIGFRTFLSHYPDDEVIIALITNTNGRDVPRPKGLGEKIARAVFAAE